MRNVSGVLKHYIVPFEELYDEDIFGRRAKSPFLRASTVSTHVKASQTSAARRTPTEKGATHAHQECRLSPIIALALVGSGFFLKTGTRCGKLWEKECLHMRHARAPLLQLRTAGHRRESVCAGAGPVQLPPHHCATRLLQALATLQTFHWLQCQWQPHVSAPSMSINDLWALPPPRDHARRTRGGGAVALRALRALRASGPTPSQLDLAISRDALVPRSFANKAPCQPVSNGDGRGGCEAVQHAVHSLRCTASCVPTHPPTHPALESRAPSLPLTTAPMCVVPGNTQTVRRQISQRGG